MSFSLIGPFSFGSKVTSAQFNQLDSDHANALDKSVAGDTLSGAIAMAESASITVSFAGGILSAAANGIQSLAVNGIISNVSGGIGILATSGLLAKASGAIQATVAGGIQSGVSGGITDGGNSSGFSVTVSGGLQSNPTGGGSGYGISLNGSNEYLSYGTVRTIVRRYMFGVGSSGLVLGTGWTDGTFGLGAGITGGATSSVYVKPLLGLMDGQINGATLSAATLEFFVGQSHSSLPATFPLITIYRSLTGTSAGATGVQNLFSGSPSAGSPTAWFAAGAQQSFSIPIVGSAIEIDLSTYLYTVQLADEQSTNALGGNGYVSLKLTFSSIGNSAPC